MLEGINCFEEKGRRLKTIWNISLIFWRPAWQFKIFWKSKMEWQQGIQIKSIRNRSTDAKQRNLEKTLANYCKKRERMHMCKLL